MRILVLTTTAGAIGGLAAGITVFGEPGVWSAFGAASWFKYVITPIILGALSAGIGVFVLTKTDTSDVLRTFFFATICGLAFPQVIDNAKRSLTGQVAAEARVQALQESANRLERQLTDSNPQIGAVRQEAERVLQLAAVVDSTEAKATAEQVLQQTAVKLAESEDRNGAIQLLSNVAESSAARGDLATTSEALDSLTRIESATNEPRLVAEIAAVRLKVAASIPSPILAIERAAESTPPSQ
jgi:hypothetical protein